MSDTKGFNPEAWQETSPTTQPAKTTITTDIPMAGTAPVNDIETVTQRIEQAHVDITSGYDNWRDIGFALSSELGENGRIYFHRVSIFNEKYDKVKTDEQYTACLNGHGQGITIKTFFQKARDAGISVRTSDIKYPKPPKSPKSPIRTNGDIGENGDSGDITDGPLPTFSDLIFDQLPLWLQKIVAVGETPQERDAILLGVLTVLSCCLSKISGQYDGVKVYANLFYFLTARASSGKGRISLCRYLALPIHRRLREKYDQEMSQYEILYAQWEGQDKKTRGPKPQKPAQSMLFIPANTSSTAVYQLLNDNGGKGLIFETEGDTLANAFASDFANFSDGFRKAFHHEPITYHRRANDEDVEIESPQMSAVLTGTPRQVVSLIGDAENGLFSRFIFYRLESKLVWKDVFASRDKTPLNEQFTKWGDEFIQFFDALEAGCDIEFTFTDAQAAKFNAAFERLQLQMYGIFKDDILASVRRIGVICFRIAMILSAIRIIDAGDCSDKLVCDDADFKSAMTISQVLAVHTARVFSELSQQDATKSTAFEKNLLRQRFVEALPEEFDRQDYLEAAETVGVPGSTAEKWIRSMCGDNGVLEKVQHGRYRKLFLQETT